MPSNCWIEQGIVHSKGDEANEVNHPLGHECFSPSQKIFVHLEAVERIGSYVLVHLKVREPNPKRP